MIELKINDQQLIPVRLIPYITGWQFSPDTVVKILAKKDKWHRVFIPTFHMQANNHYERMLPKEWDVLLADMDILCNSLKSKETVENENYPQWREQSVRLLPAATFVWLTDLKAAWDAAYSKERLTLRNERPGDRDLNLRPFLPKDLGQIIYEGFEQVITTSLPSEKEIAGVTVMFSEFHHYMVLDPYYGVLSAATESLVNSIYRDNASNALYMQFKRRFSLLPCKSDKQRELIYIWCGLMNLPAYQYRSLIDWQCDDIFKNWTRDFQFRLDDLKGFIRGHAWPLPSVLFPGELDNTDRKVALNDEEYTRAFHDFAVVLPQLKKELKELEAIQPESMEARKEKKLEIESINQQIDAIHSGNNPVSKINQNSQKKPDLENELEVGSPEWRRHIARKAADAKHSKPGGSRQIQNNIREIWATGKYSSRDICAEEECAALGISFSAARKALRNTPEPNRAT